jgi:hypothetical protein
MKAGAMDKDYLLLKRAALSRPSGQWNDDDFDVLANGEVVGRIYASIRPTHGYAATREAAMAAFAKSWRREN